MISLSALILLSLVLLALCTLSTSRGVVHNDVYDHPGQDETVAKRSMGNLAWQDVKLANELQLIEPMHMRNYAEELDGALPEGSYVIFKPDRLLINNNDVVNLTFYSKYPKATDWIGAYSPANLAFSNINGIQTTVPVKYGFCDEAPSYLTTGYGFLTFNFTNLRADIAFVFFVNSTGKNSVAMNRSDFNVSFNNFNEPLRPRVVATSNVDQYNLIWSSYNSTKPTLKWGTQSKNYINTVTASTDSIGIDELCGKPATTIGWRDLGLMHTATFIGMLALSNQKIYYIFGDANTNDFSAEFTLQVAPKAGTQPPDRGTRVILYDDLGRGSRDMTFTWYEYGRPAIRTAEMVAPEIAAGTVDAVYHGGDVSYATGYLSVWDFFANMMSPVTSGALYLTTVGNHETDWPGNPPISYWNVTDSGGECGVVTTTMYTMPVDTDDATNKPWWSYDVGIIHFVGMSTEHNFSTGSEQWNWLKNDLESVNRSVTPWVIFGGHRAMYLNSDYCCGSSTPANPLGNCPNGCAATSDYSVMWDMVTHIEPLLFQNKVNFAFYGHNHVVQRQTAVYNYEVVQKSTPKIVNGNVVHHYDDPQATVHFVIGTGGATFTKSAFPRSSPNFPEWNEVYFYEYGYARVVAVNASYLEYEWVLNLNGTVLDRAAIYQKDPSSPFVIPVPSNDDDGGGSTSSNWISNLSQNQFIWIMVALSVVVAAVVTIVYINRQKIGLSDPKSDDDYQDFDTKIDVGAGAAGYKHTPKYSPLHNSTSSNDLHLSYNSSQSIDSPVLVRAGEGGMKKVSSFEILPTSP